MCPSQGPTWVRIYGYILIIIHVGGFYVFVFVMLMGNRRALSGARGEGGREKEEERKG